MVLVFGKLWALITYTKYMMGKQCTIIKQYNLSNLKYF